MKKFIMIISIIFISSICLLPIYATKGDNILGFWERVGDDKAGLILKVVEVCNENMFIGIVAKSPYSIIELYNVKDVYWQGIQFIKENQWEGVIIIRGIKDGWSQKYFLFDRAYAKFALVNDNMMEVYTTSGTSKWLRKTEKETKDLKF